MKIGINHWSFPSTPSVIDAFTLAKQAGCDHIEVNLAKEGELSLTSTETGVRAIAAAAKAADIEISSLSTGLYWEFSPTSNDPGVRAEALQVIQKQLNVAKWLGVDAILVVPGAVTPDTGYETAFLRAQEFLQAAVPTAKETGVAIGVENVWNRFLLSPLEMRSIVDACQAPDQVGCYFDVGNVLAFGFPQDWIRTLGSRIKRIHVKDFDPNLGGWSAFRNLLQGGVPWVEVRQALEETGYDDYITAEVSGYTSHQELGLKHIADCMKAIFKS